jgi:5-methyltetrahydropteroyltriglutamate--homocysteine methyltransferase
VPRVVGPIRRREPVELRDVQFLRANTDRRIKITLPGPFTLTQQAVDDYYGDEARMAMDFAAAVNAEIHDLVAAGADVIQIDEPYLQARPVQAQRFAIEAINRALAGVAVTTVLHTCFGYGLISLNKQTAGGYPFLEPLTDTTVDQISIEAAQPGEQFDLSVLERMRGKTMHVGVIDLSTTEVEPVPVVEQRIRAALRHIAPERLVIAPDCGLKYLPRAAAFGKLQSMVRAADAVRGALVS